MSASAEQKNGNGRATSQISIYDYPEHLNPFYEDENHKRLRFWKITKSKSKKNATVNNGNSGLSRRGSFSLDGLKEMWAFKSFRLKKTKSSTLGINKTSESPPILRRQDDTTTTTTEYYNPQVRQTLQASTTTTMNRNFERNVPYRMSLQDVRSSTTTTSPYYLSQQNDHGNGFGFGRNERYRNTIQTPRRMKREQVEVIPIYLRSSQTSLKSTNPFEDEDGDDNISIVTTQNDENSVSTSSPTLNVKRPARKKRRAPPPPPRVSSTQVPQAIDEEINNQRNQQHNNEISNLTAEIESFVSSTTNDENFVKEEKIIVDKIIVTENCERTENNDGEKVENSKNCATSETNNEVVMITKNEIDDDNVREKSIDIENDKIASMDSRKILNTDVPETRLVIRQNSENEISPASEKKLNVNYISDSDQIPEAIVKTNCEENQQDIMKIVVKDLNTNEKISTENLTKTEEIIVRKKSIEEKPAILPKPERKFKNSTFKVTESATNIKRLNKQNSNENQNENVRNDPVEVQKINDVNQLIEEISNEIDNLAIELKITESKEDVNKDKKLMPQKSFNNDYNTSDYQIRYVPLNDSSSTTAHTETTNTVEIRTTARSLSTPPPILTTKPVRRRSVREIIESINRSQSLLKPGNKDLSTTNTSIMKSEENNLNVITDDTSSSNVVFEKCKTYGSRESSPTIANLDWNPVPKPKRTKKCQAN